MELITQRCLPTLDNSTLFHCGFLYRSVPLMEQKLVLYFTKNKTNQKTKNKKKNWFWHPAQALQAPLLAPSKALGGRQALARGSRTAVGLWNFLTIRKYITGAASSSFTKLLTTNKASDFGTD